MNKWSFRESNEWDNKYPKCSANAARLAPINIDTSKISPCHTTCKMAMKYGKTKCYVQNENSMPTVYFDPTSYCKFKGMIYTLKKMTIHVPSMHTVNQTNYDMEALLYFYLNPVDIESGGIIISILFKKGPDHGSANQFFNQFVNQLPASDSGGMEKDVEVGEDWNLEMIIPDSKSFFYYEGALPYPPCNQNWSIIIFEEVVSISTNIIKTIQYLLGDSAKNVRDILETPKDTVVFYNSYHSFESEISDKEQEKLGIGKDERVEKKEIQAMNMYSESNRGFLIENKLYIKGVLLTVILIFMIYLSVKIAKYIVVNDIINSLIVKQIVKKEARNATVSVNTTG
jgi:carbonic anhydrase